MKTAFATSSFYFVEHAKLHIIQNNWTSFKTAETIDWEFTQNNTHSDDKRLDPMD